MSLSSGEKWVRLLRGYAPVAENEGQQAEQVDKLARHYGINRITFEHPAKADLFSYFPASGSFQNVVLTGTAGDGKTSLCFDLISHLTQRPPKSQGGVETLNIPTDAGDKQLTLIFDVTAWRNKASGKLSVDNVQLLERMARSVFAEETPDEFFVIAVNDGQLHELFRLLPDDVPDLVRQLEKEIIRMHAAGLDDSAQRVHIINLGLVASDTLMERCLEAILDRNEWACFNTEADNPLFAPGSSLRNNFELLRNKHVRDRLIVLAKVADASGHHLPIRGILCLLTNALLGHPDAKDGVIRPGTEADMLLRARTPYKAALHKTLFGDNLSSRSRGKREVYKFLSLLQMGCETTNELDEIVLFGLADETLRLEYDSLVAPDPYSQKSPIFGKLVDKYVTGEINGDEQTNDFLYELGCERRRLFLSATNEQLAKHRLWRTSVFHSAGEFLENVVYPTTHGKPVSRSIIRKIAGGLNRIWSGLMLGDNPLELHLTTGLDITTSPISDILLETISLDSDPPGFEVQGSRTAVPDFVIRCNGREFAFPLTLTRFEFLTRVAEGAMPSTFSRECCADMLSLKPQCLRQLNVKPSDRLLYLIDVQGAGVIQRQPVLLGDA